METSPDFEIAMSAAVKAELDGVLFAEGHDLICEYGAIGIVCPSSGRQRKTLLLRQLVPQEPGDVNYYRGELTFSPRYKQRALDHAARLPGAGLAFIHTHPEMPPDVAPTPSPEDLTSDRVDLFYAGQTLAEGAPLVAAIVGSNGLWSVRSYQFQFPSSPSEVGRAPFRAEDGTAQYASAVRVVGQRLVKILAGKPGQNHKVPAGLNVDTQDSSIRLWGTEGQRILAGLQVGITGLGGVGGLLASHLARLGVGSLILVDYDRIHSDNLNRADGATRDDAAQRRRKVEVAARVAREAATAPEFEARAVVGSIVEDETIPHLLDCDLILNAADTDWARQVLDHLAYAHGIPVIDGGTLLKGSNSGYLVAGKSVVTAAGPGHPSLEAAGVYTKRQATEDAQRPEVRDDRGYIEGGGTEPERAPSVISNNALVASLMQLRLQAIALGTTPTAMVGKQRYNAVEGTLEWVVDEEEDDDLRRDALLLGDLYVLPTGVDHDFERQRKNESTTGLRNRGATLKTPSN